MIASSWWKVGLGLVGVVGVLASSGTGCGSGTSSSGTTGGDTTTSGSAAGGGTSGTGGATGGTGGDATTTTAAGTTTSGTTTTSATSSTGTGMSAYADCTECTDTAAGAPVNECKTAHDACFANKNCVQIYTCVYDPNTGCPTDASGACCVYDCYDQLKTALGNDAAGMAAAQKAIDEYHAYDDCLYCTTCKAQCSADAYCTAYAAGQAACVP